MLLPASGAAAALTKISEDPYTNASSQHKTQVEPDTFSHGSTIVSAFQSGRFTDGGASNIGWATSADGGTSWTNGFLPGLTVNGGGGPYPRASDPSVAYDAAHGVWLIASLALGTGGDAVAVNRSTNGGTSWGNAVTVAAAAGSSDFDKSWVACDNTSTSPYYGHCYAQWDDFGNGDRIKMSTSTDGGLTWGPALNTSGNATGLGGQPVVRPNGTVVVPLSNAFETAIQAFRSTNGGASWSSPVTVGSSNTHPVAGGLRNGPLPSAEIDGSGRVYVVWQDCRFRSGCSSNDIAMSSSGDGATWSTVRRIPIDSRTSGADHFIPGLGVDGSTSGGSAHLGLAYYYYPSASCSSSTCRLHAGFVSSVNGGASWSSPVHLAGPMNLTSLASTTQGRMVGDYISTSISASRAHPVFAFANPPSGGVFDEAMYAVVGGLGVTGGSVSDRAPSSGASTAAAQALTPEGLRLVLRVRRRQAVLRQRGIVLVLSCNSPCTVKARARVSVPLLARIFRSKQVTKRLAAGVRTRLKLRLSRRALVAIRRALRRHRRLTAKVVVRVRTASSRSRVVRKVRLVRGRRGRARRR